MYRPLPDGLTIKKSPIEGLGLYATKDIKANIGIAKPPTNSPTPFKVSLTATDLRPPKIAYELPNTPMAAATTHIEISRSNIVIKASDPV